MPDPIPAYIVKATSGCYEDRYVHDVCAFFDKREADNYAMRCNAWMDVNAEKYVRRSRQTTWYEFPPGINPLDRAMAHDGPTTYSVTHVMVLDRPKRRLK